MFHNISIGDNAPKITNVVVEIPKGSHNKYEFDEDHNIIKLDRVMYSAMHYPTDYGFIPETRSEDGDHLDAMVLGSEPLFPGCLLRMRPIGLLKMIDGGEKDFKIIGVQADNPRFSGVADISDLKEDEGHLLQEVEHFFARYKDLEEKEVEIIGWEDVNSAQDEIRRAQKLFNEEE